MRYFSIVATLLLLFVVTESIVDKNDAGETADKTRGKGKRQKKTQKKRKGMKQKTLSDHFPYEQEQPPQKRRGFSPKEEGMVREESESSIDLTPQVDVPAGRFWFGTQMQVHDKLIAYNPRDGATFKVQKKVKAFSMDHDVVTNEQFEDFVRQTVAQNNFNYIFQYLCYNHPANRVISRRQSCILGLLCSRLLPLQRLFKIRMQALAECRTPKNGWL